MYSVSSDQVPHGARARLRRKGGPGSGSIDRAVMDNK